MTNQCCNHGAGDKPSSTVVGLLERPLYAPGLILEDSDLTAGIDYTRELSRLLFRSLFGCGVVCGLTVKVEEECGLQVTVAPGLALDGCGDPVQVPRSATLTLVKRHGVIGEPQEPPRVRNFWVVLCAGEKRCAPRPLVCDADEMEGASQHTRARAQAEVSIAFEPPACSCGCYKVDVVTPNTPANYQFYDNLADTWLPRQVQGGAHRPEHECQERHNAAVACAPDCGCDGGCGCDCCVLLAWVHWYPTEKAWGVLHGGVRRLIRPELREDPIEDERPTIGAAGAPAPPPPAA